MAKKLPYTEIIVEKNYPIGRITINRPERRNAMSGTAGGTRAQLSQSFLEMKDDPKIRVFIVTGAGPCFSAGWDMSVFDESYWLKRKKGFAKGREHEPWVPFLGAGGPENNESSFPKHAFWDELWDNPKPSIALVRSFALGGGMQLANRCDIVFATPDALFSYPPIRYGASIQVNILPTYLMGIRRSMDMGLTGRTITAKEAYDSGIVTHVVEEDKIEEEVQKTAESVAAVPPLTNLFTKMVVHSFWENLGIKQWNDFGLLATMVMEQTSLPGHYWDLFDLVRKNGFTQAYKEHRGKWGYPDPNMDKEVERLKKLKGK